MARGRLRVYLGYAAGVGKTYAMLNEGCRRRERGTDVVVGYVETHGREVTAEQLRDLEVVPRKPLVHRGAVFEEMDVDAIILRSPEVALIDEFAHSNVPGLRNSKRWQDIEELLAAGITVITTVNIQHLESLNDVVERITEVGQQETIPDEIVRAADQIELVDMSPWALRRRMAHGNVYPPEKVDAALSNYFREGNLTALRELALLWVADRVEEALQDYVRDHGITDSWETRERVLVAASGRSEGVKLIRRASRIASRRGADLIAVHVVSEDRSVHSDDRHLEVQRELLGALGGRFHEVTGTSVAAALLEMARAEGATQIVLGGSSRSRWAELVRGSVINDVIRGSGQIDVHVISSVEEEHERLKPARAPALPPRRRLAGFVLALVLLPLLSIVLANFRGTTGLSTVLLLYLCAVLAISALGGWWPAISTAVASSLLVNWYFTPPLHTWTIADAENLFALIVFVVVGGVVSGLVDMAARRQADAERGRSESAALARLAESLLRETDPVARLLDELRSTFGLDSASVLRRESGTWTVVDSAGEPVPGDPAEGALSLELEGDTQLVLVGHDLPVEDRRVMIAFAAQLAVALESRQMRDEISKAAEIAEVSDLRAAILAAVSHDLRTPLSSIKASVSSLLQRDVRWSQGEVDEFVTTIDEETDRLTTLVENLLDMSRIQAGAVKTLLRPVGLEEIVPRSLEGVRDRGRGVRVEVPETLPRVKADAAMLERAVANLVDNALAWSPPDSKVRVSASALGRRVDLRIEDKGPGIPEGQRQHVFEPFQRLGDRSNGSGVGLGLAVAKGFIEAIDGSLALEDTPGGGLTAVVSLETME